MKIRKFSKLRSLNNAKLVSIGQNLQLRMSGLRFNKTRMCANTYQMNLINLRIRLIDNSFGVVLVQYYQHGLMNIIDKLWITEEIRNLSFLRK